MSRTLSSLSISFLLILVFTLRAYAHDGQLDVYGCHYHKDRKEYHCHEGAFKGGSFDSKIEMIRRLRLQFLNLGRPWPYGEIAEEDITSTVNESR